MTEINKRRLQILLTAIPSAIFFYFLADYLAKHYS